MTRVALLLVAAALTVGCAGPTSDMPMAKRVVGLDLWAAPLADDVDGKPGVDGVSLRLMLQDAAYRAPAIAADDDHIDLLLFEGQPRRLDEASAFHVWRLTGEAMQEAAGRYYGLWCYKLTLYWPGRIPATSTVTVLAKYRSSKGRAVRSAPATIKIR